MKAFGGSLLFFLVSLASCASTPGGQVPARTTAPAAATTRHQAGPIVFHENDFAGALAEARKAHLPVFVDAWATWCHTCLSMREYVFTDPQIRALGGRFVWLAIDTEKAENAAFLADYPMENWPTLWVLDPSAEGKPPSPALRWNGSATAAELAGLLEDAESAISRRDTGGEAGAAYLRGNQATAAGKSDEAIAAYDQALAVAPPGWPRRARTIEALSTRLWAKHDYARCAELAAKEMPSLPPGTSLKAVAYNGLMCVESLPKNAPSPHTAAIIAEARRIVTDPNQPILADDRSELWEELVGALKEAGKADEARSVASAWAQFLDREAARAPTPAARAVFDAHRLDAHLELGDPSSAIAALLKSEHDFPKDYNPPARLANAYFMLKDYDRALLAINRALLVAYGPRKLRLLSLKANIQAGKGDPKGERATLDEAVTLSRSLTLSGGYARLRTDLEKRLEQRATVAPSPAKP